MTNINSSTTYAKVEEIYKEYLNLMKRLLRYKSNDDNYNLPSKTYSIAITLLGEIDKTIIEQLKEIKIVNDPNLAISELRLKKLKDTISKVSDKFIEDSKLLEIKDVILNNTYSIKDKETIIGLEIDIDRLIDLRSSYISYQKKLGVSLDLDDEYEKKIEMEYNFISKQISYLEDINDRMREYLKLKESILILAREINIDINSIEIEPLEEKYIIPGTVKGSFTKQLDKNKKGFNQLIASLSYIKGSIKNIDIMEKAVKYDFAIEVLKDLQVKTDNIIDRHRSFKAFTNWKYNNALASELESLEKKEGIARIVANFHTFIKLYYFEYLNNINSINNRINSSLNIPLEKKDSFTKLYGGPARERTFFVKDNISKIDLKKLDEKIIPDLTNLYKEGESKMNMFLQHWELIFFAGLKNDYFNLDTYVNRYVNKGKFSKDINKIIELKTREIVENSMESINKIYLSHFNKNFSHSIEWPITDYDKLKKIHNDINACKDKTDNDINILNRDIDKISSINHHIDRYTYNPGDTTDSSYIKENLANILLVGSLVTPFLVKAYNEKYDLEMRRYEEEQEELAIQALASLASSNSSNSFSSSSFSSGSSWGSSSSSFSSSGSFGGSNSW